MVKAKINRLERQAEEYTKSDKVTREHIKKVANAIQEYLNGNEDVQFPKSPVAEQPRGERRSSQIDEYLRSKKV